MILITAVVIINGVWKSCVRRLLIAGFGLWWSHLVLKSFVGGQAARQTRLLVFIVLLARRRLARHVLVVMVMRMMVVMRVAIAVMMVIIVMMVVVMVVMDGDDDRDVVGRSIDRRRGESLCGSHAN